MGKSLVKKSYIEHAGIASLLVGEYLIIKDRLPTQVYMSAWRWALNHEPDRKFKAEKMKNGGGTRLWRLR